MSTGPPLPRDRTADASIAIWAALLAAVVATLGTFWLTAGMNLEAGPFCFCQRTCVMLAVGILIAGLLMRDQSAAGVAAMTLPVAMTGLGVAGVHNWMELTRQIECPKGILNIGSAPQQALVAQAILVFFLVVAARTRFTAAFGAVMVGAAAAWLLYMTTPRFSVPTKAYEGKLTKCRIPYVAPGPPTAK
jgi:disulfide bond formation protein DsbB